MFVNRIYPALNSYKKYKYILKFIGPDYGNNERSFAMVFFISLLFNIIVFTILFLYSINKANKNIDNENKMNDDNCNKKI